MILILFIFFFLLLYFFYNREFKFSRLFAPALLVLIPFFANSQICDSIQLIVKSDANPLVKQMRIDDLLLHYKSDLSSTSRADYYHCVGLNWYYSNKYLPCIKMNNGSDDCLKFLNQSIKSTEQALILKQNQDTLDTYSIKRSLYNLGYLNFKKGSYYTALDYYKDLVTLPGHDSKRLSGLMEMGKIFVLLGDFHSALDNYNQLSTYYEEMDDIKANDKKLLIDLYIRQAQLYASMGLRQYSFEIKRHLTKADSLIHFNIKTTDNFDEDVNHINQLEGNRLVENGQYEEALEYHRKVTSSLSNSSLMNKAIAYNNLAYTQIKLRDYESAHKNLLKAISYDSTYTDPYNNLGDLYAFQKDFKKGMYYYQKSIMYGVDLDDELEISANPTIDNIEFATKKLSLLNNIVTKAKGWIMFYDLDGNKEHLIHALETYRLADQLVDLIRYESSEQQSKLYWREKSTSLYMKAVEVCYLLKQPEEAFYFMERNKALLLLEDLTNEEAKAIANLPQKLVQREFNLKRKIYLSENNLMEADDTNTEMIAPLKDSIRENKYRYEQFVDSLNRSYPDYAKFKKKVDILSLDELKSDYISNSQLVLHYILNEDDGYGLLSSIEGSFLFQLIEVSQLNYEIDTLISLLADGNSDITTYNTTSNALFKKLIPQDIYTKIKGKHVTIIPDYTLQRLPFEALAVSINGPKYLLAEVEVSYVYSLSLLKQNSSIQRKSDRELLAFAPVQFKALGLTELPFSESEVKELAEIVPGDIQLNDKATKKAFLEQMKDHKIIHLATHADLGDGENPWIAFADEKMFLKEIYATKNQAKMVVLSACNTLDGELKRGEGIMSLARGFFYSGAESVVSSLWPVNDNVGKEIIIKFYQNLDQGDTKSKALQKAKLRYLNTVSEKKLKHPYYWAGFVVLGNNEPLSDDQRSLWYFMGMGILIVALLFVALKLFKIVK